MSKDTPAGYKVIFYCGKENQMDSQHVGTPEKKGRLAFSCSYCSTKMILNTKELSLGSHGHTKATLKHELKQVQEL